MNMIFVWKKIVLFFCTYSLCKGGYLFTSSKFLFLIICDSNVLWKFKLNVYCYENANKTAFFIALHLDVFNALCQYQPHMVFCSKFVDKDIWWKKMIRVNTGLLGKQRDLGGHRIPIRFIDGLSRLRKPLN